jgi:hypothetical protein
MAVVGVDLVGDQQAELGVDPQRLRGQPGPAGELADAEQLTGGILGHAADDPSFPRGSASQLRDRRLGQVRSLIGRGRR